MSKLLSAAIYLAMAVALVFAGLRIDKLEAENAALRAQQQDTIPGAAYLQAQVDSLMTTRHCQVESCLLNDSDFVGSDAHSHCYWERQYAEVCSLGYAGMVAARKDADECLHGWELEILRRKELEKTLRVAADELFVLRRETLRKGKEEE